MKIGIIGGGVVGQATARAFIEHVEEVRVVDLLRERSTHKLGEERGCDLNFICLPTPQTEGLLDCDLGFINCYLNSIKGSWKNLVLRSTVPIGFTQRAKEMYALPNLIHSPEFLTARCSYTDAQLPSRNIIGGDDGGSGCVRTLYDLYYHRFPSVPIFKMTSDESEAVKLFLNGFFATKVSYFNEVKTLAEALGLDWRKVMDGVMSDGRIAHSHVTVPGPDGKYGFGGTCLPKDQANLIDCFNKMGLAAPINFAAMTRNIEDRKRPV